MIRNKSEVLHDGRELKLQRGNVYNIALQGVFNATEEIIAADIAHKPVVIAETPEQPVQAPEPVKAIPFAERVVQFSDAAAIRASVEEAYNVPEAA